MAHKKAGGSSRNGRDSQSKRLGVKSYGGESINAGSIIIRQRGTKIHAGVNVGMGKDHTCSRSSKAGTVRDQGAQQSKTASIVPPADGRARRNGTENRPRAGRFAWLRQADAAAIRDRESVSGHQEPALAPGFLLVRPAGRTYLEVKVLYTPGKGKC